MRNKLFCIVSTISLWLTRVACIVVTVLMAWAGSFLMYDADSFKYATVLPRSGYNFWDVLVAGVKLCIKEYTTWQGAYTQGFFQILTSSLIGGGDLHLKLKGILHILFFLGMLFLLINRVLKYLKLNIRAEYVFLVLVFVLYSTHNYKENLYHEIVVVPYLFMISIAFGGTIALIKAIETRKTAWSVLGSALMIIAIGGNSEIAMFVCFAVFLLALIELVRTGKPDWMVVIPLFVAVAFSLFNMLAPGNFVRRRTNKFAEDKPIATLVIEAFVGGCTHARMQLQEYTQNFRVVCMLLFVGAVSALAQMKGTDTDSGESEGTTEDGAAKVSRHKLFGLGVIIVFVVALFMPVIMIMPTILGYGDIEMIPERCVMVENVAILLELSIAMAYIGSVISGLSTKKKNNKSGMEFIEGDDSTAKSRGIRAGCILATAFAVIILLPARGDGYSVYKNCITEMTTHLLSGEIKERRDAMLDIYETLGNAEFGADIVIYDYPDNTDFYYCNELRENSEDWHNLSVCLYYELNTVQLFALPEEE